MKIDTNNNRSKTQGRSLDDENTKKSSKLSGVTEDLKVIYLIFSINKEKFEAILLIK